MKKSKGGRAQINPLPDPQTGCLLQTENKKQNLSVIETVSALVSHNSQSQRRITLMQQNAFSTPSGGPERSTHLTQRSSARNQSPAPVQILPTKHRTRSRRKKKDQSLMSNFMK